MRHVLRARAQREHRKNLGAGVDGEPEPDHLFVAAQPGAQFVQLHVRELKVAERVRVQCLSVLASAREPSRDRGLSKAEDAFCSRRIQPFGQRR